MSEYYPNQIDDREWILLSDVQKIISEALKNAADRAGKEIEDQGLDEVVSVKRLRAAITGMEK